MPVQALVSTPTEWLAGFGTRISKLLILKQNRLTTVTNSCRKPDYQPHVKFELADLTQFQEKETYDLVLSVDVMEHIEEDVQVFQNFYTSMKKGGMLLISTPSDQGGSDSHDHDHEEGVHGFIDEHVRDGYNIADIEGKLKSVGFSKVEAGYSYGTPGKISWKLSMKIPNFNVGCQ